MSAAGPAVMAGRDSSHAWAPAVPVVIAAVGAVAGPRAIGDSRVLVPGGSVGPVVREGLGPVPSPLRRPGAGVPGRRDRTGACSG